MPEKTGTLYSLGLVACVDAGAAKHMTSPATIILTVFMIPSLVISLTELAIRPATGKDPRSDHGCWLQFSLPTLVCEGLQFFFRLSVEGKEGGSPFERVTPWLNGFSVAAAGHPPSMPVSRNARRQGHPPSTQTRPQPIIFIAPASDIAFLAFCL